MAKGMYLTIGLNSVDPAKYEGWAGELNACENDARDMASMCAGFAGTTLLTAKATSLAVLQELHKAAAALSSGDLLVVGYSGHGGNVGDVTRDEVDGQDETWCLYDRMLVDDELYAMWSHFRPGVRIFVLSDSCHSGTVVKMLAKSAGSSTAAVAALEAKAVDKLPARVKSIPFARSWALYQKAKPLYDALQYVAGPAVKDQVKASVILISGCQDDQLSLDGNVNGVFTATLKHVWDGGTYNRTYKDFQSEVADLMPLSQQPNYYVVGEPNPTFEAQAPFRL
ncbi:MAG: caspase family protein [Steroidobacteraceae bacterium]|nr:caspase family protein [Steroidobacteraceae bacterium]